MDKRNMAIGTGILISAFLLYTFLNNKSHSAYNCFGKSKALTTSTTPNSNYKPGRGPHQQQPITEQLCNNIGYTWRDGKCYQWTHSVNIGKQHCIDSGGKCQGVATTRYGDVICERCYEWEEFTLR